MDAIFEVPIVRIKTEETCFFCQNNETDLRSILEPQNYNGKIEIYVTMVAQCFGIEVDICSINEYKSLYKICDNCIQRLEDAVELRLQIVQAYTHLKDLMKENFDKSDYSVTEVKVEFSDTMNDSDSINNSNDNSENANEDRPIQADDEKITKIIRRRNRKKKEDMWKRTIAKKNRNSGLAYESIKTKKNVGPREIGPPCNCHCFENIGMEKIKDIFSNFWNLCDYNKQNIYLSELLESMSIKHSRIKNRPSRTSRRIKYTVKYDDQDYNVCSRSFCSIHGISPRRVRSVLDKKINNGVVEPDKRGRTFPKIEILMNRKPNFPQNQTVIRS